MASPVRNFHLPLPAALHRELTAEARRVRRPATAVAREAIDRFLAERKREALDRALASYAAAVAGSSDDLDPVLEAAATEHLLGRRKLR